MRRWRAASASDPHLAGSSEFWLDRCPVCGSAVTIGDAADPGAMYEAGTYSPPSAAAAGPLAALRRLADRDRTRFVRRFTSGARVLEVGAGDGKLVAIMARKGLDAWGIDPSPAACAAARAAGIEVVEAGVDEAPVEPASQDGVVLWHSLEHLDRPSAAMERIARWMRPGARLVVAAPNLAGLQARIGGDRWFHQDVPRHRTHFTPTGLTALLARTGYGVERTHHLLVEQNPLGMWQTLLNRLTRQPDFAFRLLKRDLAGAPPAELRRDAAVTAIAGLPLVPVAILLEAGAGLARAGGSIVVEARRS